MIRDKIIIVEDDPSICQFLTTTLTANSYDVVLANSGKAALDMIASHCPDVILLDLGLPDMDGKDVIRQLRGWTRTPIIVLSARSAEVDMLARIRAALRHTRTNLENDDLALTGRYQVGELVIDYKKHKVFLSGEDTHLTPNEYKIIALLGQHAGQVLTYKYMMKALWGPAVGSDNKLLRVHMANIRRKIEPNPLEPRYIFTEVGVGYRMADES